MTYQYKTLGLAAALALGAVFAFSPMKAEAATIYATSAEITTDGPRGTADNRGNIDNALGSNFDTFFELGFDGVVEFQFGNPTGQKFFASGSIVEVTRGNPESWPEAVKIEVGTKGGEFFTVAESFINNTPNGPKTFTFEGGPFDTVRLTDITRTLDGFRSTNETGGFDVAAIGVTPAPVPLPAAGWLMLAGFGGLAALRRRKQAA